MTPTNMRTRTHRSTYNSASPAWFPEANSCSGSAEALSKRSASDPCNNRSPYHRSLPCAARPSRYPGHIAKAERQLQDYLKMVDVVIEVRDCRIPAATTHQLVPEWVGKRRVLITTSGNASLSQGAHGMA